MFLRLSFSSSWSKARLVASIRPRPWDILSAQQSDGCFRKWIPTGYLSRNSLNAPGFNGLNSG